MFARLILFVKHLLVPLRTKPPTFREEQAFEAYEDDYGTHGQYPSPAERYQDAVEWCEGMWALPLFTLLRWRLAVAWMPFCRGETRLLGNWLSRKLFPDLWGRRRGDRQRARNKQWRETLARERRRAERAEKRKVV